MTDHLNISALEIKERGREKRELEERKEVDDYVCNSLLREAIDHFVQLNYYIEPGPIA